VLAEGAQFVVGPLAKDSVNALLSDAELSVTTLMLNYPSLSPAQNAAAAAARAGEPAPGADRAAAVGDAPPAPTPAADQTSLPPPGAAPGVAADGALAAPLPAATTPRLDLIRAHHFALAPEDEAIGAAEFAFARGARQAAVLTPEGAWGERVREAFTARWESLGGVVAASRAYPEEATGLSAAVAALLNVDQSKQRARRLRAVLVRDIKHEPTPRSDLDVVFMAAFPQTARQLKPLLLFHRADTIPVITTSHAYSATRDPALDQDIEGVVFGDMPWVLSPDSHPLPGQARRHWPSADGATGRLYAFGADAYTLVSRLRDLRRGARYPGLTGELHLTQDRHVERVLEWARIENGLPVTLDPYTAGELYWTPALP
jgi:outer membrane PBP1 activator LpoA protein